VKLCKQLTPVVAVLGALLAASVASAHEASATVDCTKAVLTYESTKGTTLSGTLAVNGQPAESWSVVAGKDVPTSGTLTVPYQAPTGPFSVVVNWQFSTGEFGSDEKSLTCSSPPVVTPSPPAPPSPSPPQPSTTPTPVTTTVSSKPKPKPKAKRCVYGRKRFDSEGHRLRDSRGRRIALCKSKPRPPVVRVPKFTG
jgi:hypothetical protein